MKNYKLRLKPISVKKTKIIIITVLLIVVFAILNLFCFSDKIRNVFYIFSLPVQRTFWKAGDKAADFFAVFYRIKEIKQDNEYLIQKNQELLSENIALKGLEAENEILRQALALGLSDDFNLILAEPIAKDIDKDFILLNKGIKHGVSENMPVITSQKIICGRIIDVYDNFSRVMLITHNQSSFDAEISEKEISGMIKGKGRLSLSFELIPKDKEIKEKDIITTMSLTKIFPKGLLVGEVKRAQKNASEPYQTAEISLFCEFDDLDKLFIITDY